MKVHIDLKTNFILIIVLQKKIGKSHQTVATWLFILGPFLKNIFETCTSPSIPACCIVFRSCLENVSYKYYAVAFRSTFCGWSLDFTLITFTDNYYLSANESNRTEVKTEMVNWRRWFRESDRILTAYYIKEHDHCFDVLCYNIDERRNHINAQFCNINEEKIELKF